MTAVLQLTEFLAAAWLLSLLADRCYRERLPRDLRKLEKIPAATAAEPGLRAPPAAVNHPSAPPVSPIAPARSADSDAVSSADHRGRLRR